MRRPWNIVDVPIYSLATYAGELVNMNICTYVTPISMKPKQYAIALYQNTQTMSNIKNGSDAVLQILSKENIDLVNILGRKSGKKINKMSYLKKKNILITWNNFQVLKTACAYVALKLVCELDTQGDHRLFIFEATRSKTNDDKNVLTFQNLIDKGLIL